MTTFLQSIITVLLTLSISFSSALVYAQQEQSKKQSGKQQEWQINFKDSDIQEVIKFVADVTEKTVIIDPRVKGKVKVISRDALTKTELYDLFLSVLETQGFTAIEVGDIVRVIPRKDARTSAVPVVNQPNFGTDAYITQVIQLYNVSASKVLPVLRPLAPQHAHLAAYEPSNAIIISDTVANISRLSDIIERIDRAGVEETDVIALRYAQATDMATMLQQLSKNKKDAPQNTKAVIVADQRSNSILVTGDEVRRQKVRELVERLDISQPQSGNVRVIYLEYADAEEVATVLAKVVSSISKLETDADKKSVQPSAANASVEADHATNSLLITADAETMESLLSVVQRLDIRRAQVLVEAIIVEIRGNLSKELGVEWAAFKEDKVLAASQNTGALATVVSGVQSGTADLSVLRGQTIGFGGASGDGVNFAGLINFFQGNSDANVLSTPSLLTTDNNEAEISIGQNVPFVTGSFTTTTGDATNPFQTIQREDVGISLKVTPQINEGDTVILDIEQEVSSISNSVGASDIITNERKISTKVIAQDGETIILGGLINDDVQQQEQKVPVLGSVPLIGNLFRNNNVTVTKSNLMVFLRASIIRDEKAMAGAAGEKYRYIRDQQKQAKSNANYLISKDVLPLIPVWDEDESEKGSESSNTSVSE